MAIPTVPNLLRDHLTNLANEGKRLDGRGFHDRRDIVVDVDVIPNAEGSAKVVWGETIVYAGIKLSPRDPFSDRPTEGTLMTQAELRPIAGPDYEPGPPSPESIELSRVVDRGIRESGCIDTEDLCIIPGEKVWSVSIDLHVICDRGNIFDACGLAAIVALNRTIVPGERYDVGEDAQLKVNLLPMMCTFKRVGSEFLYDPTYEEELAGSERISITVGEDGHLHSLQKGLKGAFSSAEFAQVYALAITKAKELREIVESL